MFFYNKLLTTHSMYTIIYTTLKETTMNIPTLSKSQQVQQPQPQKAVFNVKDVTTFAEQCNVQHDVNYRNYINKQLRK